MNTKYLVAVMSTISILLSSCERSKSTDVVAERESPSASLASISGLRLALPGRPQKAEFGLSKISKENTVSQESYIVQSGSTQYGLCKTVHHSMDGTLDDKAHGIVSGYEGYSIVDLRVAGVSGKRITMEISLDRNTQYVSILLFARDKTLWQIATIDPSITKAHAAMDALIPTVRIAE